MLQISQSYNPVLNQSKLFKNPRIAHNGLLHNYSISNINQKNELNEAISVFNSNFLILKCLGENGKEFQIKTEADLKQLIVNKGFCLSKIAPNMYYLQQPGLLGGGRLDELNLKLETKPDTQKSVFISYCWSQKGQAIEMEKEFAAKGYLVIRDENELAGDVDLTKFMQFINHKKMDYVVAIISSDYLKSKNCMYEVIQMMKRPESNSILPCVVDSGQFTGTSVYTSAGKDEIFKYWNEQLSQANNHEDRVAIRNILTNIEPFLKSLAIQLNTSSSKLQAENYKTFFDLITTIETEKGGSKLQAIKKLLSDAKFDFKLEDYTTAEETYKKATTELKQLKDTSQHGEQLMAEAYGGYAECLELRNNPEATKTLALAQKFGYKSINQVVTSLPVANQSTEVSAPSAFGVDISKVNINNLIKSIELAEKNGDIPKIVAMLDQGIPDACREKAANALRRLARNEENQVSIAKAGAIPKLITMLDQGHDTFMEQAAAALGNLAVNAENQVSIAQAGAIPKLVTLLDQVTTDDCREYAAAALGNLAHNTENQISIVKAGAIPKLVALLDQDTPDACREYTAAALNNLALNTENKVSIAKAGAIPKLIAMSDQDIPYACREYVAATLNNLSLNSNNNKLIAAEKAKLGIV